jgi:hypothetical protein
MKNLFITVAIFLLTLLIWLAVGMKKLDKDFFLSNSVLDRAIPLNVNIDIDFFNKLKNPAYGNK